MKRIINYPLLAIAMVIAALSVALTAAADTPTTLYILGQVNQNTWSPNQGVPMTRNDDGTFTADVYCKNETNDFSFAIELNNWGVLNADGAWRRYGANIADGNFWPSTPVKYYVTEKVVTVNYTDQLLRGCALRACRRPIYCYPFMVLIDCCDSG